MEHIRPALQLLGCKVQDKITGVQGTVTSICFDLYGCTQAVVDRGYDKDGKRFESSWFDVSRLTVADPTPVMPNVHLTLPPPSVQKLEHGPAEKPLPDRA